VFPDKGATQKMDL